MGKLLEGYQNAIARREYIRRQKSDILLKLGEKLSEDLIITPSATWYDRYHTIICELLIHIDDYHSFKISISDNKCNIYLVSHDSYKDEHELVMSCECKSTEDVDNVLLKFGETLSERGLFSIILNKY